MKLKRKNFGFVGNMFGAKNFQNIARMKTVNKARPGTFGAGKMIGNAAIGSAKALGSTALVAGGLAAGTAALGKGAVSKASEQSDGTKMFSDKDMIMFKLKRKSFTDFKNMSTEKLEKITAQNVGPGNNIVAGAKQELSNRTPILSTQKPNTNTPPKPNTNGSILSKARAYWNNMSKAGKLGVVGTSVLGAGLMAKGLFGGKKKEQQ